MLIIVKLICERTEACGLRHNRHFILSRGGVVKMTPQWFFLNISETHDFFSAKF